MKKVLLLLLAVLIIYTLQAQTLVAYYPFSGNANDASGNGINGTVVGATLTTDRNNTANQAYQFVPNQYINLGNVAALKPTAAITFGGWFYRPDWTTATGEGLFSCTETSGYELYLDGSNLAAWVYRNGGYATINIPVASISAGWHMFVCTYDGRYTRIFMDGFQQSSFDDAGATYPITYAANNVIIGAEASSGSTPTANEYFTGKIDDIRVYNDALTSAVISTLYAATLPVHLQQFSVTGSNGAALVKWSTENETDFARYEVERGIDGIHFSTVSMVAANPVNGRNTYSLNDAVTKGATYFYRLKMIDKDGTFTYSEVLKYTFSTGSGKVNIYPNPVSNYFVLEGTGEISQVDIISLKGSLVKRFKPTAGNRYGIQELSAGMYTVRVTLKDQTTVTARLVK